MPTVMPHSELVRQAVEYIGLEIKAMREENGAAPSRTEIYNLVERACLKFDLNPLDSAKLHDFLERDRING